MRKSSEGIAITCNFRLRDGQHTLRDELLQLIIALLFPIHFFLAPSSVLFFTIHSSCYRQISSLVMDKTNKPADSPKDTPEPNTPQLTPPAEVQQQWVVVSKQDNECEVITAIEAEQSATRYTILFGPTDHREEALDALVLATKGGLPKEAKVGEKSCKSFQVNVNDTGLEQFYLPVLHAMENTDPDSRGRGEIVPPVGSMLPRIEKSGPVPAKHPLRASSMDLSSHSLGIQYPGTFIRQPLHTPTLPPTRLLLQETQLHRFSSPILLPSVTSPGRSPTALSMRQEQHSERSSDPQAMSRNIEIAGSDKSGPGELDCVGTSGGSWECIRPLRTPPGPSRLRNEVVVSSPESDRSSKSPKRSVEEPRKLSDDSQEGARTKKGYWDVVL